MWRTSTIVVVSLCLGGCVSYRSVSGRVFGPGDGALDQALSDSGSTSLQCAPSRVRIRRFATGYRNYQPVLLADGCGQRASYAVDCSDHSPDPVCPNGGLQVGGATCPPDRDDKETCELVLISRVKLD